MNSISIDSLADGNAQLSYRFEPNEDKVEDEKVEMQLQNSEKLTLFKKGAKSSEREDSDQRNRPRNTNSVSALQPASSSTRLIANDDYRSASSLERPRNL